MIVKDRWNAATPPRIPYGDLKDEQLYPSERIAAMILFWASPLFKKTVRDEPLPEVRLCTIHIHNAQYTHNITIQVRDEPLQEVRMYSAVMYIYCGLCVCIVLLCMHIVHYVCVKLLCVCVVRGVSLCSAVMCMCCASCVYIVLLSVCIVRCLCI